VAEKALKASQNGVTVSVAKKAFKASQNGPLSAEHVCTVLKESTTELDDLLRKKGLSEGAVRGLNALRDATQSPNKVRPVFRGFQHKFYVKVQTLTSSVCT
jgi:hypothetical protein